ncbi:MAG: hypothetical protein JOY70_04950 [Acidisphaera sp.]|nr:hypothetical protein [Acidisphaera sp.]
MSRFLCFATGAALLLSSAAQARCTSPADQVTFELQGLKSELQVLTLSCSMDARYNAFVRRFQPRLGQDEKDFSAYFHRAFGGAGQREQDAYVTLLANAHAEESVGQGSDYCARNALIFDELAALPSDGDLIPYVAGKAVVPATAEACPGPTRPAPATRTAARRSARR